MKKITDNLFLLLLMLASCAQPYELSQSNLSVIYEPEPGLNTPEHWVLHKSDSVTEIYLSFRLYEYQYLKKQGDASPVARIRMSYKLIENYESKVILDSATYVIMDSLNYKLDRSLIRTLELTAKKGEYLIRLVITDLNSNRQSLEFIPLYKDNSFNQQNFLLKNTDNELLFSTFLKDNQSFIIYSQQNEKGELWVRYYNRDFPIALPPFTSDYNSPFDYKADSTFRVILSNHETPALNLPKEGFYHFQIDSSQHEGLTLFRFGGDFPALTSASHLLQPLRYITTSKEYAELSTHKNPKMAVDSFWLDNCSNINRARGQIAKYYNRVQDANRLFTSYLEGWKTDRGIIYVVFGPPTNVYRGINTENWVYGEAGHSLSIRFSFIRVNNPFSFNDYSLYRNPLYKEAWYNAVENWRH